MDSEFGAVVAVKVVAEGIMIGFFVVAEEEEKEQLKCIVKFAFWLPVSYHFFSSNYEHIAVDPLQTIYPQ